MVESDAVDADDSFLLYFFSFYGKLFNLNCKFLLRKAKLSRNIEKVDAVLIDEQHVV